MKTAIDDKCLEIFKQLKFEKKYRYIIYKVEGEKIVNIERLRWSNKLVSVNKVGTISFTNCPSSNTGLLCSIWNSKPMTVSTPLKFSSATGLLMALKSKTKCFTRLERRPSSHTLTSILNKLISVLSMRYRFILHR